VRFIGLDVHKDFCEVAVVEKAYRRFVKDFRATGRKGAGAATGARISSALKGQAARQGQAPDPAL
jgi:hypothetical protein